MSPSRSPARSPRPQEAGVLSPERLDELPKQGNKQLLAVDVPANAQPNFPGKESGFMWGPAGQDGAMEIGPDGRGRVYDEVYGFWVDMGRGVVVSGRYRSTTAAVRHGAELRANYLGSVVLDLLSVQSGQGGRFAGVAGESCVSLLSGGG